MDRFSSAKPGANPDETNFGDSQREIPGTLGDSDKHGTGGGIGVFAANCGEGSPI